MDTLLPAGWLPRWMLLMSVVSVFNTLQTFSTQKLTQRIYNRAGVTPLQTRTFGIWTLVSATVRLYAAYHIHDAQLYHLAIGTYAIAFLHFTSEWLIFRSASLNAGLLSPLVISTSTLAWMAIQYGYYVK